MDRAPRYSWFSSSQSERDLYRAESISSGERQAQQKPKQPLSGVIQESTRQMQILTLAKQMYPGQTDFF